MLVKFLRLIQGIWARIFARSSQSVSSTVSADPAVSPTEATQQSAVSPSKDEDKPTVIIHPVMHMQVERIYNPQWIFAHPNNLKGVFTIQSPEKPEVPEEFVSEKTPPAREINFWSATPFVHLTDRVTPPQPPAPPVAPGITPGRAIDTVSAPREWPSFPVKVKKVFEPRITNTAAQKKESQPRRAHQPRAHKPPAHESEAPRTTRRRKPVRTDNPIKETLGELLDHLESIFETLKLPAMPYSWLRKEDIVGLRKLGIHVPSPALFHWQEDEEKLRVRVDKTMPAMMAVSLSYKGIEKERDDDVVPPHVMFGIKLSKLPWNVRPYPGIPYIFGYAFGVDKELAWMHLYLTVDPKTGEIHLCDELYHGVNHIPVKSPATRRKMGSTISVPYTQWASSRLVLPDAVGTEVMRRLAAKNFFLDMFNWWVQRDERWSVSVKKDGERVTFGIPKEHTKTYFADRNKMVNERGGTRRIMHFVHEHVRKTRKGDKIIAEHVRGLREFDWRGYHCIITAPKLTGFTAASFAAAATEVDSDEEVPVDFISTDKVGQILAEAEEFDRRQKK